MHPNIFKQYSLSAQCAANVKSKRVWTVVQTCQVAKWVFIESAYNTDKFIAPN